jgi:hypothetical protein
MCMTPEDQRRREQRVRGFLATVEDIARDAAREEAAKAMVPVRDLDLAAQSDAVREAFSAGRHLTAKQVDKLRSLKAWLKAADLTPQAALLDEAMGWN